MLTDDNIASVIERLGTPAVLPFITLLHEVRATYGEQITQLDVRRALRVPPRYIGQRTIKREGGRADDCFLDSEPAPNAFDRAGYIRLLSNWQDGRWHFKNAKGKPLSTVVYFRPALVAAKDALAEAASALSKNNPSA